MGRFAQSIGNESKTFNGAVTLASSTNSLVDLFFLFGSSRGKDITSSFDAAWKYDPDLTIKIALWARDIRGGAGERQQFRNFLTWLVNKHASVANIIDAERLEARINAIIFSFKISELGRWDDYLVFYNTKFQNYAYMMIHHGLHKPETVGLVSKWMPRQGPIARSLADYFHVTPRNWRKLIVAGTDVVEQKMCARKWSEINFSHVPSVASARYQKAFNKRAPIEYAAYKASLVKGEAKVNASAVYPYDVLKSLFNGGDGVVAEEQWASLPNYLENGYNILPLVDVSGSMSCQIAGSTTAMQVAISLGLYIAERQQGDFHNVVMNFSSESEIIKLEKRTLIDRYREISGMNWGMSTDLEKAFTNLLNFANRYNLKEEDMPKIILVLSDMEFNITSGYYTNFQIIEQKYKSAGYTRPNIVFWNLNGRMGNSPVTFDQNGTAMVSGFSPSLMKSIISGKSFTPVDIMLETVNVERYTIA